MLRPEEAWSRLAGHIPPPARERLPRREALGCRLAVPLAAVADVPAVDVSAMDGFAIAGEPPAAAPLPVVATIAAGDPPGWVLPAGAAARIMTGAPLPAGADRVVPVEQCREDGAAAVTPLRGLAPGANVRRRGEIHRAGDLVLEAGALLTPGALALAAAHGHAVLEVARRPRVAILTTGDEVVAPEAAPGPGQLRDSHTDFLLAACRTVGVEAEALGIAPDRPAELRSLLERALRSEVALVTGGVSMGARDLVEGALAELGCEMLCDGVAMQPGKPLVLAAHAAGLVFGLPGNPASAMVGFWLYVRPALRRMMGCADAFWHGALAGTLTAPLPAARDRDRFLPAAVRFEAGGLQVEPQQPRGSHDLGAFARGTALVRVRAGEPAKVAGDGCEILPFVDWLE